MYKNLLFPAYSDSCSSDDVAENKTPALFHYKFEIDIPHIMF